MLQETPTAATWVVASQSKLASRAVTSRQQRLGVGMRIVYNATEPVRCTGWSDSSSLFLAPSFSLCYCHMLGGCFQTASRSEITAPGCWAKAKNNSLPFRLLNSLLEQPLSERPCSSRLRRHLWPTAAVIVANEWDAARPMSSCYYRSVH